MGVFKNAITTALGQELLIKAIAGETPLEFTRIAVSEDVLSGDIASRTTIGNIKQSKPVSSAVSEDGTHIRVSAGINNETLSQGYYVRNIGLYANDPDVGEILYSISVADETKVTADWMPAFTGTGVSSLVIDLVIALANGSNVTVVVDDNAYVTVTQLNTSIKSHTDNKDNPHGVTARQVGAFPLDGSMPLTGKEILIKNGYGRIAMDELSANIQSRDNADGTTYRSLWLCNSSFKENVADAFNIIDVENSVNTTYRVYGEHNAHVAPFGNPNLLINSDFRNPVNQRGKASITNTKRDKVYFIDRWYLYGGNGSIQAELGKGLVLSCDPNIDGSLSIYQDVEYFSEGTYTLSAKIDGKVYSYSATLNQEHLYSEKLFDDNIILSLNSFKSNSMPIAFGIKKAVDLFDADATGKCRILVEWVKLEAGSVATPFVPRLYAEELLLCQRYYMNINTTSPFLYGNYQLPYKYYTKIGFNRMRVAPTLVSAECKYFDVDEKGVTLSKSDIELFSFGEDYIELKFGKKEAHSTVSGASFTLSLDAEIYE